MEFEERHQDVLAVERCGVRREIDASQVPAVGGRPAPMHPRPNDDAVGETGVLALARTVGCVSIIPAAVKNPPYEMPKRPTRPLWLGTCRRSQSTVSHVSDCSSTSVGVRFSG